MILVVDNRIRTDRQTAKSTLTDRLIQMLDKAQVVSAEKSLPFEWKDVDKVILSGSGLRLSKITSHPVIDYARTIVAEAVKRSIPCLGICFGFQLLAWHLGHSVSATKVPVPSGIVDERYFNHHDCVEDMTGADAEEHHAAYEFVIYFQQGVLTGVQWHPEGSAFGTRWLREWVQC